MKQQEVEEDGGHTGADRPVARTLMAMAFFLTDAEATVSCRDLNSEDATTQSTIPRTGLLVRTRLAFDVHEEMIAAVRSESDAHVFAMSTFDEPEDALDELGGALATVPGLELPDDWGRRCVVRRSPVRPGRLNVEPCRCYLVVASAIQANSRCEYEQLAVQEAVKLIDHFVADHHDLLLCDPDCLSTTRRLLGVFVRPGSDEAIQRTPTSTAPSAFQSADLLRESACKRQGDAKRPLLPQDDRPGSTVFKPASGHGDTASSQASGCCP